MIAFYSNASNLVLGDDNGAVDVFVHHRPTGTTQRVSVSTYGFQSGFGLHSLFVKISSDGRTAAFLSVADNLVAYDTNSSQDVFVRKPLKY